MSGLNKAMIIGNLGQDPEIKRFDDGGMLANVSIATSEKWKDKTTGEAREKTEWHRVVFRQRLAEIVEKYVKKGDKIYVEGKLATRKYEKDGVNHYSTEIQAFQMQMLGSKAGGAERDAAPASTAPGAPSGLPATDDDVDDDIPF